MKDAQIVFAAGAIGVQLLKASDWQNNPTIEMLADVNAQPPLGIGGLKLKLHRGCIGQLFESSEGVLDAEEIYKLAKGMA